MSHGLHERLDDLVADAPTYVVPDARVAWAVGARRRARQRIGVVGAVVVVIALVAGVVAWVPRTPEPAPADVDRDSFAVDGYPARVIGPWAPRDLPVAPGPMAMLYATGDRTWWAADAEGRSWRVPQDGLVDDYPPALSPDGRMLGYLSEQNTYVVQDLVAGDRDTGFSLEGGGSDTGDRKWQLASQAPGFWSPDGRLLLLRTSGSADGVVLDPDSTFRWVIRQRGFPAGWLDGTSTAWLVPRGDGRSPRLVGVDVRGHVTSRVDLAWHPDPGESISQWSGSLSPDGRRLAVVDGQGAVITLSVATGAVLGSDRLDPEPACNASWRGDDLVVTRLGALVSTSSAVITGFDPEAVCALAAAEALVGQMHDGTSRWWLVAGWTDEHAKTIGIGVLLAVVIIALRLIGRRRKALAPTS